MEGGPRALPVQRMRCVFGKRRPRRDVTLINIRIRILRQRSQRSGRAGSRITGEARARGRRAEENAGSPNAGAKRTVQ